MEIRTQPGRPGEAGQRVVLARQTEVGGQPGGRPGFPVTEYPTGFALHCALPGEDPGGAERIVSLRQLAPQAIRPTAPSD